MLSLDSILMACDLWWRDRK